jgi:ribosomal protein S18 acetylase RimI-like enzyme
VFNIRNASSEDIPLIRELTYQVWPQTYAPILSQGQIDYMLEMMYSPAALEKQMQEGCQFVIIYNGQEPVGFASFQEIHPGKFKLHKIYVLISQQGKGSGKFLLNYVLDTVRSLGGHSLQLQVNKDNNAKQFYEKMGFTEIDKIKLDIGDGYIMDDFIMEKKW